MVPTKKKTILKLYESSETTENEGTLQKWTTTKKYEEKTMTVLWVAIGTPLNAGMGKNNNYWI